MTMEPQPEAQLTLELQEGKCLQEIELWTQASLATLADNPWDAIM